MTEASHNIPATELRKPPTHTLESSLQAARQIARIAGQTEDTYRICAEEKDIEIEQMYLPGNNDEPVITVTRTLEGDESDGPHRNLHERITAVTTQQIAGNSPMRIRAQYTQSVNPEGRLLPTSGGEVTVYSRRQDGLEESREVLDTETARRTIIGIAGIYVDQLALLTDHSIGDEATL
jgi:hypothetical protein